MVGYLSLGITCSSKLTVFLELRSQKTVRFSFIYNPPINFHVILLATLRHVA